MTTLGSPYEEMPELSYAFGRAHDKDPDAWHSDMITNYTPRSSKCEFCDHQYRANRPDWDEYFLAIAEVVATRGDCSRRKVGAIVVRDNRIVATGYNGAAPGRPGCLAGACPRAQSDVEPGSSYDTGPGSCIAIHAEANALLYAGVDGSAGSILYVTEHPCDGCWRLIAASGISLVFVKGMVGVGFP